ncbi:MAG: AraC family transcriptional regulator [Bacillota bacterium]
MNRKDIAYAVGRMQAYIERHITEPITLLELARCAGYSPFHAARIFREEVGKTPFAYIRALRMTKAALTLRDQDKRVLDVALDFVFDSHEGFTRAFSREFGITPHKYQQRPVPLRLFLPYSAKDRYVFYTKGEQTMEKKETSTIFVQVIERPKRKLILKRGMKAEDYFAYCEELGCDIWGILTSIKDALYEPIGMWLPKKLQPAGTSEYAQGVEVPLDYAGEIPEGFEIVTLEPCKMMIFQGQPYDDAYFETAILALQDAIKDYDPTLYGYVWADEDAPRFQLEPVCDRGYIEGRPVKEKK